MKDILTLLVNLADTKGKEKLSTNERYSRLKEESDALWDAFCENHEKEVRTAAMRIMDMEGEMSSIESAYSLLLGMQIGFAVGTLELTE